jgi:Fic family protein
MVSIYDVFYVVAKNGKISIKDVAKALGKSTNEYQSVFNCVLMLERRDLVLRKKKVSVVNSERAKRLFDLISFCLHNSVNYNVLFKDKMLYLIEKASKKEFFTIADVNMHAETFKFYTEALSKYGFLIIISRNPLKCKLLKGDFLVSLLKYFKKNARFYIPKKRSHIPDITRELKRYRRHVRISKSALANIESKRETGFIYSSLTLEGNPLTLPETERLLIEDIVPANQKLEFIDETRNYKWAVEEMIENSDSKKRLDMALILHYHDVAMHGKDFSGKIRKQNVFIKKNPDFVTSDWKDIERKLSLLMDVYTKFEDSQNKIVETIIFASYFHNEFQRIHPFIDGNSRISRLLMLHILRMHGLPVLELPIGYFDSYLNLTKRSKKRDDEEFRYLIEEIVLTNLKNLNNSINVYAKS